jgi:tRNA (cytosine34-C5)-methyltransferase
MGKWNRKRKQTERREKEGKQSRDETSENGGGGGNNNNGKGGGGDYSPMALNNAMMEAYYDIQGLYDTRLVVKGKGSEGALPKFAKNVTKEDKQAEKDLMYSTIRSILPASFRIGQDVPIEFRRQFVKDVQTHCGETIDIEVETQYGLGGNSRAATAKRDGEEPAAKEMKLDKDVEGATGRRDDPRRGQTISVKPARPIPYIPHGYQLSVDRRTIRRNPKLAAFHDWLKVQTGAGFLTRQETVSMIPPVVLDVQPGDLVLDMCAAPGSKTSQMLEIVSEVPKGEREPRGLVVANDNDVKRAYMLVTQLRRINSPAIFMTSCDAQQFPQLIKSKRGDGEEGMFDRVLADVPCTGDGTVRKNPGVWKHWTQIASLVIHPVQTAIALKGARLTKVGTYCNKRKEWMSETVYHSTGFAFSISSGICSRSSHSYLLICLLSCFSRNCVIGGYLCYSTCSMNPIENEAAVAELLRLSHGSLELVDRRSELKGMIARPGWTSWKVMTNVKKENKNKKHGKNSAKMILKRKEWAAKDASAAAEKKEVAVVKQDKQTEEASAKGDTDMDISAGKTTNGDDCASKMEEDAAPYHDWDDDQLKETARKAGLVVYDSYDDVPEESRRRIRKSCFPPTEEEIAKFHLERCMRILPQDMDTGGFFVALLKKVAPIASSQATKNIAESANSVDVGVTEEEKNGNEGDDTNGGKERGQNKPRGSGLAGVGNSDFVRVSDDIFPPLKEFYGLADDFPQEQIMAREGGKAKVMYFVTKRVTDLIQAGIQRCTVINGGLKAFERNSKECRVNYRVNQEGIQFIAPYMTKRKIVVNAKDFCTCCKDGAIWLENFSSKFKKEVLALDQGSFVVVLKGFANDISKKMVMVMWRCRSDAINCLVNKLEMEGLESKLRALGLLVEVELKSSPKRKVLPSESGDVGPNTTEDETATTPKEVK